MDHRLSVQRKLKRSSTMHCGIINERSFKYNERIHFWISQPIIIVRKHCQTRVHTALPQ